MRHRDGCLAEPRARNSLPCEGLPRVSRTRGGEGPDSGSVGPEALGFFRGPPTNNPTPKKARFRPVSHSDSSETSIGRSGGSRVEGPLASKGLTHRGPSGQRAEGGRKSRRGKPDAASCLNARRFGVRGSAFYFYPTHSKQMNHAPKWPSEFRRHVAAMRVHTRVSDWSGPSRGYGEFSGAPSRAFQFEAFDPSTLDLSPIS